MIKCSREIRTGKEKISFELKDNVGTRISKYKLTMNKFGLEIKRKFLTITPVKLFNSLTEREVGP